MGKSPQLPVSMNKKQRRELEEVAVFLGAKTLAEGVRRAIDFVYKIYLRSVQESKKKEK